MEECFLSWWRKKNLRGAEPERHHTGGRIRRYSPRLGCRRWMQPSFPPDSRQDKKYSLMNSINCTQPRSIGQSSAQSLSLSVMLAAGETAAHQSRLLEIGRKIIPLISAGILERIKCGYCSCDVLVGLFFSIL